MNRFVQIRLIPVIAVGGALCMAGLLWPESEYQRPLTVALNIWPGTENLVLACDAGNTREQRINTVEMSWPTAVMGAFRKRVVDAAVVTLDEMIRLEADGAKPRAILVLGVSKGSDAIMGHAGMESMQSLRGRRVGVEIRSSGEHLLWKALAASGMSVKDVQMVPLNLAETEDAYDEHELDAVVTADPWRLRLRDKGAVTLFDSARSGLEFCRVLVVREEVIRVYPNELKSLVSECLRLSAQLEQSDSPGLDAALRREGFTLKQWRESLQAFHMPDAAENRRLLRPGKGGLEEYVTEMVRTMLKEGMLHRQVNVKGLFIPNFLEEGS
ncbi:ABC transporter substrate-binding protein [Prosthecobacter sp.]|uniref:ABC transporter substrate-binding protein n=1 Tax=Prosthecobacter sp. TaxID=1965333 RepID=UPI003784F11D